MQEETPSATKGAQAPPSEEIQKSNGTNGTENLVHEPQVPPLKLGILIFMFLGKRPFPSACAAITANMCLVIQHGDLQRRGAIRACISKAKISGVNSFIP